MSLLTRVVDGARSGAIAGGLLCLWALALVAFRLVTERGQASGPDAAPFALGTLLVVYLVCGAIIGAIAGGLLRYCTGRPVAFLVTLLMATPLAIGISFAVDGFGVWSAERDVTIGIFSLMFAAMGSVTLPSLVAASEEVEKDEDKPRHNCE